MRFLRPYSAPERIRTWPNLHTLFTLATLVANVACLVFPNPISIGINITIRCASIVFAIYAMNKAKISSDILGIVAILIIKNGAIGAIASDLIFEGVNFSRCEVSCELLKTRFSSFFDKPKKPPLDIRRFVDSKLKGNPKDPLEACDILGVPLDKIDDQEFIEIRYNSRNRDTAYKTLKERNEANSKY